MQPMNPELCFENYEINPIPLLYSIFIFSVQNYSKIFSEICQVLLALNVWVLLIKLPPKKTFHQFCKYLRV